MSVKNPPTQNFFVVYFRGEDCERIFRRLSSAIFFSGENEEAIVKTVAIREDRFNTPCACAADRLNRS